MALSTLGVIQSASPTFTSASAFAHAHYASERVEFEFDTMNGVKTMLEGQPHFPTLRVMRGMWCILIPR